MHQRRWHRSAWDLARSYRCVPDVSSLLFGEVPPRGSPKSEICPPAYGGYCFANTLVLSFVLSLHSWLLTDGALFMSYTTNYICHVSDCIVSAWHQLTMTGVCSGDSCSNRLILITAQFSSTLYRDSWHDDYNIKTKHSKWHHIILHKLLATYPCSNQQRWLSQTISNCRCSYSSN